MSIKNSLIPPPPLLSSGGSSSSQNPATATKLPAKESELDFKADYHLFTTIVKQPPSHFSEKNFILTFIFNRLKVYGNKYHLSFEPTKDFVQNVISYMTIESMQKKFTESQKLHHGTRREKVEIVETEKKIRRTPEVFFELACSKLLDLIAELYPKLFFVSPVESYIRKLDFESFKTQDEKTGDLLAQLACHRWTIAHHLSTLLTSKQLKEQANVLSDQTTTESMDWGTFTILKTFFDHALQIQQCIDAVALDDLPSLSKSIAPFANTPFDLNQLKIHGASFAEYVVRSTKHPETIPLLHQAGVRFDGIGSNGLMTNLAVQMGKAYLLEPLKNAGAPLDFNQEHTQMLQDPPIIQAIRFKELECLKVLLNLGATLRYGSEQPAPRAVTHVPTDCLEILATKADYLEILATKVDLEQVKDAWNNSLVHSAVEAGCVDCLKVLAAQHVDMHAAYRNKTPAHVAIEQGKASCLQVIADAERRVRLDRTLIDLAILNGQINCLEILVAKSEVANQRNETGKTAATLAVELSAIDCLSILAAGGVDMNASDKGGRTPATLAVTTDKVDCLKALAGKANLNAPDASGDTPTTLAVWLGKYELLPILRALGVDLEAQDANGLTPAACAIILQKKREIEKFGVDVFKGEQIIQAKHIASVLDPQNTNYPLFLERKLLPYQMKKMHEYMQAWLDKDVLPPLEANDKETILNALTPRNSASDIFEEISRGRPVFLEHAFETPAHTVSFVFFEDKLIVCNRRASAEFGHSGIQCFSCPSLHNPGTAREMIQDLLFMDKLEELNPILNESHCKELYLLQESPQNSGTCNWSNLESGILGLFSCVLEKRIPNPLERLEKAQELYTAFTAFVRQKCLEQAHVSEDSELS